MATNTDSARLEFRPGATAGIFRYFPLFLFVLILYVAGRYAVADPGAPFTGFGDYSVSWTEFLLLTAAVVGLLEQMKVSHPGIDNTLEALTMVAMGVVQLILFILGVSSVAGYGMFNNALFLILTVISLAAAVTAVLINARTLRRTIGVGDN